MTPAALLLVTLAASSGGTPRTIILLDESGSMVRNDPQRLSDAAVRLYVDLAGADNPVGLIAFADRPRTLVPLTTKGVPVPRNDVVAALLGVRYDGRTTDIEAAVAAAEKMLLAQPVEGSTDTILVLTDGRVDLGIAADRETKKSIQRLEDVVAPRLAKSGIRLYTIAFTDGADQRLMSGLSNATNGAHRYLPDAKTLHRAFTEMFTIAAETETLPIRDGAFLTDREINATSIVMSKSSPDGRNKIHGPNDEVLTKNTKMKGVEWRAEDAYDHVTFVDPDSGVWKIEQSDTNVAPPIAIVQDSSLEFSAKAEPALGRADEPFEISAWFVKEGKLSKSFALHKHLGVTASFERKGKPDKNIELTRHKDGTYRSTVTLKPGRYRVILTARSDTIERERALGIEVFGQPKAAEAAPALAPPPRADPTQVRLERGPWPWLFAGASIALFLAMGFGFVSWRRARRLEDALAETPEPEPEPTPIPPPVAVEAPASEAEWKVVLLNAEDVESVAVPAGMSRQLVEGIQDATRELEELRANSDVLESVLDELMQTTVTVTAGLQNIGADESIPKPVVERHKELLEKLREIDEGFGTLLDGNEKTVNKTVELNERLNLLITESGTDAPSITHNDVNELILARADGQTVEEFEQLRSEMFDSLRDGPELDELRVALEEKSERMKSLESTLEEIQKERATLESSLNEVTEEYTRMFNEFQA